MGHLPYGANLDLCCDVSGLWNVGTSLTASSRPSGSWHCPGEGSLWVYSKDSVRDGGSGHTLNSAFVPHGVAVKQLSVGRLRLGIGRGVTEGWWLEQGLMPPEPLQIARRCTHVTLMPGLPATPPKPRKAPTGAGLSESGRDVDVASIWKRAVVTHLPLKISLQPLNHI